MGRAQTKRVVINVTPAQQRAVDTAVKLSTWYNSWDSKNDALVNLLKEYCDMWGVVWPEHEKLPTGGTRPGAGRKRKIHEPSKNGG